MPRNRDEDNFGLMFLFAFVCGFGILAAFGGLIYILICIADYYQIPLEGMGLIVLFGGGFLAAAGSSLNADGG